MKWQIEETAPGLVDLWRDGKIWRYDRTMEEAMDEIRSYSGPGTRVEVTDSTGYATTETVD